MSEGGKEPPSRLIKQFSELFKFRKLDSRGRKGFFDTLPRAAHGADDLFLFIVHQVAQVTLQIVAQPRQHPKVDARHPVLTIFLQLCALHIRTQNDLVFADPAHQAVFFDRQNDPPSGLVFSLHAITSLLRLYKSHVEFDGRIILLYN